MRPRSPAVMRPSITNSDSAVFAWLMTAVNPIEDLSSESEGNTTFSLDASVLGCFSGADVVTFKVHNLDQIPKGIPGVETRPKW